jgi:putative flavoprotein involved in K+ transport
VTGRDGGRDIDLRQHALEGMELYGRLLDVKGDRFVVDDDLALCLDQAYPSGIGRRLLICRRLNA